VRTVSPSHAAVVGASSGITCNHLALQGPLRAGSETSSPAEAPTLTSQPDGTSTEREGVVIVTSSASASEGSRHALASRSAHAAKVNTRRSAVGDTRLRSHPRRSPSTALFLLIDNGPCHRLEPAGCDWLARNHHRLELHRLPPYSPELNGIEGVWKATKKRTTHNRFYPTVDERDAALIDTIETFTPRGATE
jgi:transposase